MRVDGQRLAQIALRQDLHRDVLPRAEADRLHRLDRDHRVGFEAGVEVADVDRLGVRPERLERHRHLLRRPAELPHPHVDRHLAALEARPVLRPRPGAGALLAATRRLAGSRALAPADPLARTPAAGSRLQ
jgi:hypothetical protein